MTINSVEEAWRRVAEGMSFLEQAGELTAGTTRIEGETVDCRFSARREGWKLVYHMGLPEDGN